MNSFIDAVEGLMEQSQGNQSEGDYEKDGLLYCGKCNTPKQVEVLLCGKISKPYCMCECEAKAYEEQQARNREIFRREEIERNRSSGFLDLDMINCRFEYDDKGNEKISGISQRYVEHFQTMYKRGKGLIFSGGTGTGKSFMAACIANALIDKGFKCLVTSFPRIINELSGMFEGKQAYINDLNRYALLVIDDLAVERNTDYTAEIVQNVIDSRYRSGLPLIVTTNLSISEIMQPTDIRKQRLFSRLKEMCLPIEVTGQDRREKKFEENFSSLSSLLGI
jgi:DNA replication protein DnaC